MDSYLLSIIEAAEAGLPTPGINLVTNGGDWIRGQPCSSNQFREITWSHFFHEVDQKLRKRPRHEQKQNPADPEQVASKPFAALAEKPSTSTEPALSLTQAHLAFGGRADGMKLAAVRVPIKAISSWWVSGGSYIKPPSNGGVFGGLVFPISN